MSALGQKQASAQGPIDRAAQPKSKTLDLLSLECSRVQTLQGRRWQLPQCMQGWRLSWPALFTATVQRGGCVLLSTSQTSE